jgi:hypothetical protein
MRAGKLLGEIGKRCATAGHDDEIEAVGREHLRELAADS